MTSVELESIEKFIGRLMNPAGSGAAVGLSQEAGRKIRALSVELRAARKVIEAARNVPTDDPKWRDWAQRLDDIDEALAEYDAAVGEK